ncbi:uncharacterized protein F4822DRAFT_306277 [Hypoxylon trugodes]|uniref:uncharacterized protein n=1 Tax=Hypoxylon trugodes TaxID=326681 RepID=UPI002198C23E|nr:uncharacterized protein F4822DRAFT_306277 [Hypoxylon trugodes]KAI1386120.1 hypothetical protein F4822DRAFT_306277 [Hypoxylon trugodes]
MGIASGVGHVFQSIVEVIQGLLATVINFFQWIVNSIIGVFQAFVHFVEGTLGFAIHNFFILGTLAAVVFGYLLYTQRQGTAPVSRSVKNKS